MRAHPSRACSGQLVPLQCSLDTQLVAPFVAPSRAAAGRETHRQANFWLRALRCTARSRAVATAAPPSAPTTDLKEVPACLDFQVVIGVAAGAALSLMQVVCLLLQILEALFEQRDLTEQETTSAIEVTPG